VRWHCRRPWPTRNNGARRNLPAGGSRCHLRRGLRGAGPRIAYCPDPTHHPAGPLAAVVRRVLDGYASGTEAACLACGTERRGPGRACPMCGVHPDGPGARWRTASEEKTWDRIWRRDLHEVEARKQA
jgi:hypothetical protein